MLSFFFLAEIDFFYQLLKRSLGNSPILAVSVDHRFLFSPGSTCLVNLTRLGVGVLVAFHCKSFPGACLAVSEYSSVIALRVGKILHQRLC